MERQLINAWAKVWSILRFLLQNMTPMYVLLSIIIIIRRRRRQYRQHLPSSLYVLLLVFFVQPVVSEPLEPFDDDERSSHVSRFFEFTRPGRVAD